MSKNVVGINFGAFLIGILIGCIVLAYFEDKRQESEIMECYLTDYSSFIANGIEYKIEDITDYDYIQQYSENDVIVFKMENSDEVHVLKDMITWHKN